MKSLQKRLLLKLGLQVVVLRDLSWLHPEGADFTAEWTLRRRGIAGERKVWHAGEGCLVPGHTRPLTVPEMSRSAPPHQSSDEDRKVYSQEPKLGCPPSVALLGVSATVTK